MDKKGLTERDICTKFITPNLEKAGWDLQSQIREEVYFTKGRIIVRGKLVTRGKAKRADYLLYYKPNIPIAIIEAKDNNHAVGDGIQQGIEYAAALDILFVFSSNGDGFLFHDRTGQSNPKETEISINAFPSPDALWQKFRIWKGLAPAEEEIILQNYFEDSSGKEPRYYQRIAINRAIEAISKGQNRILLVMATGTGKTYTAFQIIWRLWKTKRKKRILYLSDRNVLIDQTMVNDFRPFGNVMAKLSTSSKTIERTEAVDRQHRRIDTSYEIYLALYQAITGPEEHQKLYRELSPDFFDLIVVDECHRGSAAEDSAWREILEYFSSATQIGMTATPKETEYVSNIHYFGNPVYSYSLKQGIHDGFLTPYKVIKVHLDVDIEGYRPAPGEHDKNGYEIEDRIYNQKDFDRDLVIDERTKRIARKITEFLKESGDRFQKTIVFCVDTEHAGRMRQALINENEDLVQQNDRYVMRITGDDAEGVAQVGNFIQGHEVWIFAERIEYLDQDGKLVTETLRDYSKKTLRNHYASLDEFLRRWRETDRKQAIIEELENEGVIFEALAEEVNKDIDPFDLICFVAFDQPPLTRRERVQNIRKHDIFTKYGEQARRVLEALLQKYEDAGVTGLDDPHILKVAPFDAMGTPMELLKQFGGRDGFEKAVHKLQSALYQEVA